MANSSVHIPFSKLSTAQWRTQVESELKGKSFDDFLVWNTNHQFKINAWQNEMPDPMPSLPPKKSDWKIVEPIYLEDASDANAAALHALNNGASSIWFQKSFKGAASEIATNNIDQQIAPVFIHRTTHTDPYGALLKHRVAESIDKGKQYILNGKRLRERGATEIEEIALLISQAIEICETVGYNNDMVFHTSVGTGFLAELSKIRSLRWLWSCMLSKAGLSPSNPTILASNLSIGYSKNDEHTNILRATCSAMAAAAAGASYIMLEPWDRSWNKPNEFSTRISRNIQTLLKDEARMDKSYNPADGSFFIENLTKKMAEQIWNVVHKIENEGGFTPFASSGNLKKMLSESRDKTIKNYKTQDYILLGANKYAPKEVVAEKDIERGEYQLLPAYLHLPSELNRVN